MTMGRNVQTNTERKAADRARRLREKAQILREYSSAINQLTEASANNIEKKYEALYGENWRTTLPFDKVSMIEESIRIEKINAVSLIEEQVFMLKSSETTNMSLIRR